MAKNKSNGNVSKLPRKETNNKKKKESMQRLREEIKNDPALYEEAKRKERERYHARKKAGKIKSINQMSDREQRKTRKKWRESSKKVYDQKKKEIELEKLIQENSPPLSPLMNLQLENEQISSRERMNRHRRRRNTRKLKNKIRELEDSLKKAKRNIEKYKKRAHRLENTKKDTPTKNVEELIKGQNVSSIVKRKLLYGEVITKQLRENFKDKKKYRKVVASVAGKVVKKYRFITELSKGLSFKMVRHITTITNKKESLNRIHRSQAVKNCVREFLEKDEHSRMCPGVKDTVTFKKDKRQKRYLNDSMLNLHKIFSSENPQYKLSYATFCKVRPFWTVMPKVTDRDTCICTVHENMNLLVNKLFHNKVIKESSPKEVCKTLCCKNEHLQEACLARTCKTCKNNKIEILDCDLSQEISFEHWFSKKCEILVKGEKKACRKTVKEVMKTTKQEAFLRLEQSVLKFMVHIKNIKHQYKVVEHVKKHLTAEQVLIHMDFSENYSCKYGKEIQSAHFGGSKPQISLHTVVLYYRCEETKQVKSKSVCTVSANLRHDSSAICAHLKPIAEVAKEIVPNLKEVHFLSDSVTNQYRNKKMFFLIKTQISKMFEAAIVHWHYSEAGHGKGAPDGIGGCLKRTADSLVAQGKDVSNVDSFVFELKRVSTGIKIFSIDEENFFLYEKIPKLDTFVGTLKVHNVIWCRQNENLQARSLSCFKCAPNTSCKHYGLGEIQLPSAKSYETTTKKLSYANVYTDSEDEDNLNSNQDVVKNVNIGDWVAVIYDETWYPGIVEARNEKSDHVTVTFMDKTRDKLFWPTKEDRQEIKISEIFCTIKDVPIPISTRHFKLKSFNEIDTKVKTFLK